MGRISKYFLFVCVALALTLYFFPIPYAQYVCKASPAEIQQLEKSFANNAAYESFTGRPGISPLDVLSCSPLFNVIVLFAILTVVYIWIFDN